MLNNPFCYTPSPAIVEAARDLTARIDATPALRELFAEGKMLGVLEVPGSDRASRFLYAFSGLAGGSAFVEGFVPFFIEEGFDTWGGQPLNDKPKLKKLYPDSLVFTHQIDERPDASDEEIDAAVAKFMEEFGYDNRGFYGGFDPRYRRKVYEASRKNYDRLVAEGKAVV